MTARYVRRVVASCRRVVSRADKLAVLRAAAAHERVEAQRHGQYRDKARAEADAALRAGRVESVVAEHCNVRAADMERFRLDDEARAEACEIAVRNPDDALLDASVREAVRRLVADLRNNWNMDARSGNVMRTMAGRLGETAPSRADRERARLRDLGAQWLGEERAP